MSMLGTMGFSAGEVAFFTPPPRAPRWPGGGGSGERGGIGRLFRLIRRKLANAPTKSPVVAVPRLRNYPY